MGILVRLDPIIARSIVIKSSLYKEKAVRLWCGDASRFSAGWIKGKVNADVYLDAIKDYVRQSRDYWGMDAETFIFQQDYARMHTASTVMAFFEQENILFFLGQSTLPTST